MSGRTRALMGSLIWVLAALPMVPNFHHGAWAHALLAFAALVLAPLLFDVVFWGRDRADAWSERLLRAVQVAQLPAAALLMGAIRTPSGWAAVLMALPWVAVLGSLALVGARRVWRNRGEVDVAGACEIAGLMYAAVGAAWLLADRAELRPLGFTNEIVLLTAVHFHFAGVLLPVLAGRALRRVGGRAGAAVGVGVIAGVPAVAIGITCAQLHVAPVTEAIASLILASAGFGVAVLHGYLALWATTTTAACRVLWAITAMSLAFGMVLAGLYGMREFLPLLPWLDIPWMRALHGSVNALGFGLCGTLGWWEHRRNNILTHDQT